MAVNAQEAQDIMNAFLTGAYLSGFTYNRDFIHLHFDLIPNVKYKGYTLPSKMIMRIESQWRINAIRIWDKTVEKLYRSDVIEPMEPILTYELTSLMWDKKHECCIEKTICSEDTVRLLLTETREIVIFNHSEYDAAWILYEMGKPDYQSEWSLSWSDGYIFSSPM